MGIGSCSFVRGQCWVTCWHGYWHVPKSTGYDQYSSSALSPILLVLFHQRISTTGMYKMMVVITVIDNSTIGNQYHMYLCSLQDWGDVQEPSRHPCSCSQCTTSTKCRIGSWTCFWRTQAQDYGIWEASHGIYLFWLSTTPSLQLRRQVCKVDWSYANTSFGWWQKIGSRSIQACSQQVCFNDQPYHTLLNHCYQLSDPTMHWIPCSYYCCWLHLLGIHVDQEYRPIIWRIGKRTALGSVFLFTNGRYWRYTCLWWWMLQRYLDIL